MAPDDPTPKPQAPDEHLLQMDPVDIEALTSLLRRLRSRNPNQSGFHISVPITDTLYADAHITIQPY